jgi:adenosylmethionine-8-amino-7-oxononanoate aminotransferase
MLQVRSRLWLPFTQMQSFDGATRCFVRGQGTVLTDAGGRELFDAISSVWTIVHGHGHPAIVEAILRQARTLDHSTTLGATNPAAEELAATLCALTGMDYAFFASDGASAIEAAVKMTLQFWQQSGEPQRRRFLRLVDAYHGDTAAAMSLSDIGAFKSKFDAITFETLPYECADELDEDDVAAIVVEPMIQAAAGMRVVERRRYERLKACAPLVIVDEIATGFGRTGTMFAFEQIGLDPDVICMGKGLTGGVLALSATLVRERVYQAFLGAFDERKQFLHGHSFAGNPIACAAAIASLRLFEEEQTLARAAVIAERIAQRLGRLRADERVLDVRQCGTMAGIELNAAALPRGDARSSGWRIADALYERGHFTRPIGDVVQFVPPLSSRDAEIDRFFDAFEASLA